ncbi:hypothetical protein ACEWPL_004300 [Roseovarius sp. S1116L3]|uniref:hypothetical protein n=1 Tax=Roseovarius roseus TaxID=3342636 RepID=UPI00372B4543
MFIVVGLVLAFVLIVIFSNARTRNCRWREDRTRDRDGQRYFRCLQCGHETYTETGKPPKICLADTPGP